jgi:acyl-CoA hydrolase
MKANVLEAKTAQSSYAQMMEMVLPNDTNSIHNLRGGKILHWMDICSAISAGRHAESVVVTVSVDQVSFENPIKMGDVVTIQSKVTRAFSTSMEVKIEVWAENIPTKNTYKCNSAYYTFVALDSNGKPKNVAPLIAESEDEKSEFISAQHRRDIRLFLAGRLKFEDAHGLKEIFK